MQSPKWIRYYLLVAGAMDSTTGALLLIAPASTLKLMLINEPADPTLTRFVGAFVLGVGLSYFTPWLHRSERAKHAITWSVLQITALVRSIVASFVFVAVLRGWLAGPWITVGITDGLLAIAQLVILRNSALEESSRA